MENNISNRASCEVLLAKLEEEQLRQKVLKIQYYDNVKLKTISYDYAVERVSVLELFDDKFLYLLLNYILV